MGQLGFGQFILLNYKKSAKYILAAQSKINENDFDLDQHPKQNDKFVFSPDRHRKMSGLSRQQIVSGPERTEVSSSFGFPGYPTTFKSHRVPNKN